MKSRARMLRKNATAAETLVWHRLRNRRLQGYKFRRQHPIGHYIVDFVCLESKLIVELDGSQHVERETYDNKRTDYLNHLGFDVLRFWNNEVFTHLDGMLERILCALEAPHPGPRPHPSPLPEGEGTAPSPWGEGRDEGAG